MYTGYIKLWRRFCETSFYKDSSCVHLAVHLLIKCNHEPNKYIFNGKEEICDRGQTVTGLFRLHSETGISIQSLRTSLAILENVGFSTSKSTNKFRVITIGKYNDYQDKLTSKSTINQQSTNNQLTTNKNDKNVKNKRLHEDNIKYFIRPTIQELTAHIREKGSKVDPEQFMAFYDSKGWLIGKSPMKDWKAAIRTWDLKDRQRTEPKRELSMMEREIQITKQLEQEKLNARK